MCISSPDVDPGPVPEHPPGSVCRQRACVSFYTPATSQSRDTPCRQEDAACGDDTQAVYDHFM